MIARSIARALTVLPFCILPGIFLGLLWRGNSFGWWLLLPALGSLWLFFTLYRDGVFDA